MTPPYYSYVEFMDTVVHRFTGLRLSDVVDPQSDMVIDQFSYGLLLRARREEELQYELWEHL